MSDMQPHQRVAVLVDTQNLYHSGRELYGQSVNYRELLSALVGSRDLVQATAYAVRGYTSGEEDFFQALRRIGYETRIKEIREFPDGTTKADWNVGICLDAVSIANAVDTVVLCTGDGDFARLVRHLQHKGVRSEVAAFHQTTSSELRETADSFVDIGAHQEQLLF
jgi:uncharacterized LabA/DUF88 family protein